MEKVKDILGPRPPFRIHEFEGDPIDPHKIWVSYDSESDSIVIFLNGSPEPSVSVHTENDFYAMVSLKERRLIGFHVENWEKVFVPAHAEIQAVWTPIKQTQSEEQS